MMTSSFRQRMILILLSVMAAGGCSGQSSISIHDLGPQASSELYDFRVAAEEMILAPEHIFNFNGTLSIRPDIRQFGFSSCFSPSYLANPFYGIWKYENQPVQVSDYIWYPSETIAEGRLTQNVAVFGRLIPLTGQRAFVYKLILENRGTDLFQGKIAFELKGKVDKTNSWGWVAPYIHDGQTAVSVQNKSFVFTSPRASLAAVFNPEAIDINEQSAAFEIDLKPSQTQEITVLVGIGDNPTILSTMRSLIQRAEEKMADSTRRWEENVKLLQQRLPRLITANQKLQNFYQRSLLTFLTTRWELEDAVFTPWYSESGIDGGAVCNYLWGDAYVSKFMTLAEPEAVRSLILTSLKADYSSHYAIDFSKGEGLGVGYSYDYYSMALLMYDYITLTGDKSILDETVRGKLCLDVLYEYVFEREDMTKPPVLIDYGQNHNLLELHRTQAYQHYTPSPNLERILSYQMIDRMFQWKGRPSPVDFKSRADQLRKVIFDELWNENLKWFHSLDEKKQPQVCYSIQIFDMLRAQVLTDQQAGELVKHLNEDEFLSKWGVHSMSKKDPGYDTTDIDWGGPGVYAGDAPELVKDLLQAGFSHQAIDVLERILWWGDLPYIPQAVRADSRDYRRDGRANVIAGLTGAQAIIWGFFGIRVDGENITINPIQNSYISGMRVENLNLRGMSIDISVDTDCSSYTVTANRNTIRGKTGQPCILPLKKL